MGHRPVFCFCIAALVLGCSDDARTAATGADGGRDSGPRASLRDAGLRALAADGGRSPAADGGGTTLAADGGRSSLDASLDAGYDAATEPPRNESFDTATPLDQRADVYQRVFNGAQADYFWFQAEQGDFYMMVTDDSPISPDNVITVFDENQQLLARNDSGSLWPGDSIDARLIFRAPQAGKYYVRIEDINTPDEDFNDPFALPAWYRFNFIRIAPDMQGYAFESDDPNPAPLQFLSDTSSGNSYITLLGTLDDGDSDSFPVQGMANNALIGEILAAGTEGDGSSLGAVDLRVRADEDQSVLADIVTSSGQTNLHPPLGDAGYRVELKLIAESGDNGFYAVNVVLLADNPTEQAGDDDKLENAQPVMMQVSATRRRGLLLAQLPHADIDYYSFDATAGEHVVVACEGESAGSGVRKLHAELRDAQDKSFGSADETPLENLLMDSIAVTETGPQFLRLSSATPAGADPVEPWVRCVVLAGP
jgi:hypothetical protein